MSYLSILFESKGTETFLEGVDDVMKLQSDLGESNKQQVLLRNEVFKLKSALEECILRENILKGKLRTKAKAAAAVRHAMYEDLQALRSQIAYYERPESAASFVGPPMGHSSNTEFNSYLDVGRVLEHEEGDFEEKALLPTSIVVIHRMLFEEESRRLLRSLESQKKRIREVCDERVGLTEARMRTMKEQFQDACRIQKECESRISAAEEAAEKRVEIEIEMAANATTEHIKKFKDEAEATIDQLSVKVSDIAMALEAAQAENEVLQDKIDRMQNTKKALAAKQIMEMEQNLDLLYKQVIEKEEKLTAMRKNVAELMQKTDDQERRQELLLEELQRRNDAIEILEGEVQNKRDELVAVNQKHEEAMQHARDEANQAMRDLEEEFEHKAAQNAQPVIDPVELQQRDTRIAELEATVVNLEETLSDCQDELANMREKQKEVKGGFAKQIEDLKAELEKQRDRLEEEVTANEFMKRRMNSDSDRSKVQQSRARPALELLERSRVEDVARVVMELKEFETLSSGLTPPSPQMVDVLVDQVLRSVKQIERSIEFAQLLLVSSSTGQERTLPSVSESKALNDFVNGEYGALSPADTRLLERLTNKLDDFVNEQLEVFRIQREKERKNYSAIVPEGDPGDLANAPSSATQLSAQSLKRQNTQKDLVKDLPGDAIGTSSCGPQTDNSSQRSSEASDKKGGKEVRGTSSPKVETPPPPTEIVSPPKLKRIASSAKDLKAKVASPSEAKASPVFVPVRPETADASSQTDIDNDIMTALIELENQPPPPPPPMINGGEDSEAAPALVTQPSFLASRPSSGNSACGPSSLHGSCAENQTALVHRATSNSSLASLRPSDPIEYISSVLPRGRRMEAIMVLLRLLSPRDRDEFTKEAEHEKLIKERVANIVVQRVSDVDEGGNNKARAPSDAQEIVSGVELRNEGVGHVIRMLISAVPTFCRSVVDHVSSGKDVGQLCRQNLSSVLSLMVASPFGPQALDQGDLETATAYKRVMELPHSGTANLELVGIRWISLMEWAVRALLSSIRQALTSLAMIQQRPTAVAPAAQPLEQTNTTASSPMQPLPNALDRPRSAMQVATTKEERSAHVRQAMVRSIHSGPVKVSIANAVCIEASPVWGSSASGTKLQSAKGTAPHDVKPLYKHGRADVAPAGHFLPRQFTADFDATIRQSLDNADLLAVDANDEPTVMHSLMSSKVGVRASSAGGARQQQRAPVVESVQAVTAPAEGSSLDTPLSKDELDADWTLENQLFEHHLRKRAVRQVCKDMVTTIRCGSAPLHRKTPTGDTPPCAEDQSSVVFVGSTEYNSDDEGHRGPSAVRPGKVLKTAPKPKLTTRLEVVRQPPPVPEPVLKESGILPVERNTSDYSDKLRSRVKGASVSATLSSVVVPNSKTTRRIAPPATVFQWQKIQQDVPPEPKPQPLPLYPVPSPTVSRPSSSSAKRPMSSSKRAVHPVVTLDEQALSSIGTPLREWMNHSAVGLGDTLEAYARGEMHNDDVSFSLNR